MYVNTLIKLVLFCSRKRERSQLPGSTIQQQSTSSSRTILRKSGCSNNSPSENRRSPLIYVVCVRALYQSSLSEALIENHRDLIPTCLADLQVSPYSRSKSALYSLLNNIVALKKTSKHNQNFRSTLSVHAYMPRTIASANFLMCNL